MAFVTPFLPILLILTTNFGTLGDDLLRLITKHGQVARMFHCIYGDDKMYRYFNKGCWCAKKPGIDEKIGQQPLEKEPVNELDVACRKHEYCLMKAKEKCIGNEFNEYIMAEQEYAFECPDIMIKCNKEENDKCGMEICKCNGIFVGCVGDLSITFLKEKRTCNDVRPGFWKNLEDLQEKNDWLKKCDVKKEEQKKTTQNTQITTQNIEITTKIVRWVPPTAANGKKIKIAGFMNKAETFVDGK